MRKIIKATYKLPEINEVEGTETLKICYVHILFEDKLAEAHELLDSYFAPLFDVQSYELKIIYPFKSGYHYDVDLTDKQVIHNARERKILKSKQTSKS